MRKRMNCFIVDSHAWLNYLDSQSSLKEPMDSCILKTPQLVFAEVTRVLKRRKISEKQINEALGVMSRKSIILDLPVEKAIQAGFFCEEEHMHLSDAIVYSYASEKEPVLTGDPHFKGKKNVHFVD